MKKKLIADRKEDLEYFEKLVSEANVDVRTPEGRRKLKEKLSQVELIDGRRRPGVGLGYVEDDGKPRILGFFQGICRKSKTGREYNLLENIAKDFAGKPLIYLPYIKEEFWYPIYVESIYYFLETPDANEIPKVYSIPIGNKEVPIMIFERELKGFFRKKVKIKIVEEK